MLPSVSTLASTSWASFRARYRPLLAISAIMFLPSLVQFISYPTASDTVPPSLASGWVLLSLLGFVLQMWGTAALITFVAHPHQPISINEAFNRNTRRLWPLIWTTLLVAVVVILGLIALIIPGIYLAVAFSFVTFSIVLEDKKGLAALRASRALIKDHWWAVFGRFLALGVIIVLAFIVLSIIVGLFTGIASPAGQVAVNATSLVGAIFVTPFSLLYSFAIYSSLTTHHHAHA